MDRAAGRTDRFLSHVSDRYLEKAWKRTKARALAADPMYAEIEAMRTKDTAGILLFDPTNPRLGWDAWEYQNAVEAVFQRQHALLALARWGSNQPLSRLVNGFFARRQRAQRGWDFRAVYGLDHHLASTLGPQLLAVAEISPNPDGEWREEMRTAGEALSTYARKEDIVLSDDVAPNDMVTIEAEIAERARQSIHWIADNLTKLSK